MNRAERRRQGIKDHKPTYNLNTDQIQQLKDNLTARFEEEFKKELTKARIDALQYASDRTVAAFVICLHDKFGFGKERISRLLDYVSETFACVDAEKVTLEDLLQICSDMSIEITDRKPEPVEVKTNEIDSNV